MTNKVCINCIHKDVCYMYRLNIIGATEGYCNNYYEEPQKSKWIKKVDDVGFVSFICSNCGFELELEDCFDSYYCTRCGRKMTEADKEITTLRTINLCDDCRFKDDCNPTLTGRDGVGTTECSKYERADKEADNEAN